MHTHIHTYIRTHTHTCTHIRTHIHTYIHAYKHTYIHTYIYTYIRLYIYTLISAHLLGSSGRVEVLCSPFGETRVRETLGPGGHTATLTYPHLPPPTATYRHLRRLVTLPQISMKIIHVLLYVPANIQYFTLNSGQVIMKIINFCNTYKLKRSFPILQEIIAIVNATQIN